MNTNLSRVEGTRMQPITGQKQKILSNVFIPTGASHGSQNPRLGLFEPFWSHKRAGDVVDMVPSQYKVAATEELVPTVPQATQESTSQGDNGRATMSASELAEYERNLGMATWVGRSHHMRL